MKHNLSKHRIYHIWTDMMRRCYNKNCTRYKDYGDRNITVCDEWHNVKNFINDMFPSFIEGLTLDRENNNKGYSKNNCRWVSVNVQNRNNRKIRESNTSGYRGVSWNKQRQKYRAYIMVDKKQIHLGLFTHSLDGALAYDKYVSDNNLEHTKNF